MSDHAKQMTEDEAAEFAEQVFDVARRGDTALLTALLAKGLPVNLRNHKGDTLLMLAAYHGHVDAVKVLLEHKADPEIRNDNGQSPIAGAAFKGDLPVVKALAPLPDNLVTLLDGLQPQGAVRNLQLDYRPQALADQRLQFSANLDQVGISPFHGAPGASNVSGSISGDLGQGQLRLAADNFALELAPLFAKPWQYRRANALLQWRISPDDVTISSPLIQLDGEEGQLAGDLMIRLALDPQVEDYMDLRVGIRDGDARYTAKYLPGALSPPLREWLSTAIVSGKINQGYFQYQGSLAKDAAPTASTLSLFFQVQDAELAYQPGWPALRGGDAQVFVDDQGVRVQLAKGQVLDVELEDEDGRLVYEVKLLQAGGRLVKLELDAASGELLKRRVRDRDRRLSP